MLTRPPSLIWLRQIPKVELHLHLEGSIQPSLLRQLAAKNSVPLPPLGSAGETREPAYRYDNFIQFLDCFKTACSTIHSPEDLAIAADVLFDTLIHENVRYTEIFISPVIHERKGISTYESMKLIHAVAEQKRRNHGFRCQFLFDAVRQWGVESCALNARLAEACSKWGIVGIGIGGDESSLPAQAFSQVFQRARAAGLRLTAHAGEHAGPESVREALRHLHPERIGHGIRAADDPQLLDVLLKSGITLDISLTSNLRTSVCLKYEDHPIKKIHAAHVPFTLNTDDPALFDTTISQELLLGSTLLGLECEAVAELMIRALHSSFLPGSEKDRMADSFRSDFRKLSLDKI